MQYDMVGWGSPFFELERREKASGFIRKSCVIDALIAFGAKCQSWTRFYILWEVGPKHVECSRSQRFHIDKMGFTGT